jgi:hypothetical protein
LNRDEEYDKARDSWLYKERGIPPEEDTRVYWVGDVEVG